MSEEQHHVEDFLNPEFERFMNERGVAVLLSTVTCSHEIAIPEGHPNDGVGIDYASISTRSGEPEGIREASRFAIMSCADGIDSGSLIQAWINVETERVLKSAICFSRLMENLSERGLIGDAPHFVGLLNEFDRFRRGKKEMASEPDSGGERDTDGDCVRGLTDHTD